MTLSKSLQIRQRNLLQGEGFASLEERLQLVKPQIITLFAIFFGKHWRQDPLDFRFCCVEVVCTSVWVVFKIPKNKSRKVWTLRPQSYTALTDPTVSVCPVCVYHAARLWSFWFDHDSKTCAGRPPMSARQIWTSLKSYFPNCQNG